MSTAVLLEPRLTGPVGQSGPSLADVASPDALLRAWQQVGPRTKTAGADGVRREAFERDAGRALARLSEELLSGRYAPQPVRRVSIPKPSRPSERRTIGISSLRDRIVQEAVRTALGPAAEGIFLDCSYGYRPGKGPVRAIARLSHHLVSLRHRWAAGGDIDDCFGSLDHRRVIEAVRSLGADEGLVRLVQLLARMGAVDASGRWHDVTEGVSQGSILSPLLANLYLHPFDVDMRAHGFDLVRYADDFVVTTIDRETANQAYGHAVRVLREQLGLTLNDCQEPIRNVENGITFLGIRFDGRARRLAAEKEAAVVQRVRAVERAAGADLVGGLKRLEELAAGWRRYYGQVLEPEACTVLDDALAASACRLVSAARRTRKCPSTRELTAALAVLRPVGRLDHEASLRWRASVTTLATTKPTDRSEDRQSTQREAAPAPKPDALVRQRKRQYARASPDGTRLVVNTPGSFLGKSGNRFVVRQAGTPVADVLAARVGGITLATHGVAVSTDALALAVGTGIAVVMVGRNDQPFGIVAPVDPGDDRIPLFQLAAFHEGRPAFEIARYFVRGKMANQLHLAQRLGKYRNRRNGQYARVLGDYVSASRRLVADLDALVFEGSLVCARERMMGIEGRSAACYWKVFSAALAGPVDFPGRRHQDAVDLVNVLLNYGYGVLRARVHQAVLHAHLLPGLGFLHATEPGRASLVFDLMEEFRAPVVDRTVLTLVNRREPLSLDEEHRLTAPTRALVICRLQQALATPRPWRGKESSLGEIIDRRAANLARHVSGTGKYRPYLERW